MKRAIIVDDEADIGHLMTRILSKVDIECSNATRIERAKEMIRNESYDIFFIDLNFPDGSGTELIPIIKEQNEAPYIVIISAEIDAEKAGFIDSIEVDGFIKKPFTKQEILSVLPV